MVKTSNLGFFFNFFFYRILSILTHTQWERGECFKETNNGIYLKGQIWYMMIRDFTKIGVNKNNVTLYEV